MDETFADRVTECLKTRFEQDLLDHHLETEKLESLLSRLRMEAPSLASEISDAFIEMLTDITYQLLTSSVEVKLSVINKQE